MHIPAEEVAPGLVEGTRFAIAVQARRGRGVARVSLVW
jgi:hypothetical protein